MYVWKGWGVREGGGGRWGAGDDWRREGGADEAAVIFSFLKVQWRDQCSLLAMCVCVKTVLTATRVRPPTLQTLLQGALQVVEDQSRSD